MLISLRNSDAAAEEPQKRQEPSTTVVGNTHTSATIFDTSNLVTLPHTILTIGAPGPVILSTTRNGTTVEPLSTANGTTVLPAITVNATSVPPGVTASSTITSTSVGMSTSGSGSTMSGGQGSSGMSPSASSASVSDSEGFAAETGVPIAGVAAVGGIMGVLLL